MPRALVLYHYLHPDDVVSAVHLTELCSGLAGHGWSVEAVCCNRGCRDEKTVYPPASVHDGVRIRRVWRPPFKQASSFGRFANSAWMIAAWSARALLPGGAPDVLVVGTDPVLSVVTAVPWRIIRPRTKIVHWCFDLYPEAAIADGMVPADHAGVRMVRRLMRSAYNRCDSIVELGSCMRSLLEEYSTTARFLTLTPWALTEPGEVAPQDAEERDALFRKARLGLLYSGNFGRAHSSDLILRLARSMRDEPASFAFSVRGNRWAELVNSVDDSDENVHFASFVAKEQLDKRLGAADIHMVSLRNEWTGMVVPSKFFGALAVGRPVLFSGSPDSAVARWIREYRVGWVLTEETLEEVRAELVALCESGSRLHALFEHCHRVYQQHFSRAAVIDGWHAHLSSLLA
ncbi:MAG: glycosyltransferase family 4 protein [Bryobacteraceae bacterium]